MTIGDRIKGMRIARGWTQDELAKKSGLSRTSIHMYEANSTMPRMPQQKRLAKALGVSVEHLQTSNLRGENVQQRIMDSFPNAKITESDEKISINIISRKDERPMREFVREKVIKMFDNLNDEGQERVFFYIDDIGATYPRLSGQKSEE